jgi:hypothetical protein
MKAAAIRKQRARSGLIDHRLVLRLAEFISENQKVTVMVMVSVYAWTDCPVYEAARIFADKARF